MVSINNDNIITNRTTYQIDYTKYDEYKKKAYSYERDRKEESSKPTPPPVSRDHETFAPWKKGIRVPFDLLLTPKDIVNTNPKTPFVKVKSLLEQQTEEIIKTRPRVYMAPACCLDDVPDPDMRKLFIDQTYTTEWRKAEKEATANFKPVEPSILDIGQKDNVKLEIDAFKPLEEKFRIKGKQWDDEQPRCLCDPTTEFWLTKDPPVVCGACVDPLRDIVPETIKQTIKSLIAEENLRLSHDKASPTYAGYRPLISMEIPLSKTHCPITHPLLSTYQTVTGKGVFPNK